MRVALAHHVAQSHGHLADDAGAVGFDLMLQLHGLDHGNRLAFQHLIAVCHAIDRDDRALDGRGQAYRAVGAGQKSR